jgi:hypothetical protein
MAYDRYDRDERSRWSEDRNGDRWQRDGRGGGQDRGFFERAGDEIASWFGDDDAERRRRRDEAMNRGDHGRWTDHQGSATGSHDRDYDRGYGRDYDRDRTTRSNQPSQSGDWNDNRGAFARGGSSAQDYNRGWRRELWGSGDRSGREPERDTSRGELRGYRPMAGDYGRSSSDERSDYQHSQSPWGRDEYRRTSFAGSRDRDVDPHYSDWRDRHLSDLDRDYEDYRREHQAKFESDFGSWRERRQQKRGLLRDIREHMDVVGSDEQHIGTVDRVAGDRIILTKSDPDSGSVHHSLSCSDIDRVEDGRVILDCTAAEARNRWRDESRNRALFERDDQGEMGPRVLDRSFEGTYR